MVSKCTGKYKSLINPYGAKSVFKWLRLYVINREGVIGVKVSGDKKERQNKMCEKWRENRNNTNTGYLKEQVEYLTVIMLCPEIRIECFSMPFREDIV